MSKNPRWIYSEQNPAQKAVVARLLGLKSNPFEAARKGNLPRTYVYEFLTGKKRSFRGEMLKKFADALEWSPNEVAAILAEDTGVDKTVSDPLDRLASEAAFSGLVRILRPDLAEDMPALVELFRVLALMPPESHSSATLEEQMFLRAQLSARRFAPKVGTTTESPSPRRGLAPARISQTPPTDGPAPRPHS